MIIFWRLILAHLLADFTFQTNKIAQWKRKSILGIIFHAGIFFCIGLILSWDYRNWTWWRLPGWMCLTIIFLIHIVEDYYRIYSIKRSGTNQDNVFFFLWDQFIHILLIFTFTPPAVMTFNYEKIVMIMILLILATHFSSILIYYIEDIVYGIESASNRLKNKYIMIGTRLIIFLLFLLPNWWFLIFLPASIVLEKVIHKQKFTQLNVFLSFIFIFILGTLARLILYK